ncbi:uncharacterized protein LOC117326737 [Pecten maximus]|uniref:uncharacterized protein LOC117326737 n=1 Tax=Pecten maximus TaxID=6579 RepID=UPI00145805A2|nr:uncharacterized protein LOC117326737 [Pecten maximus]
MSEAPDFMETLDSSDCTVIYDRKRDARDTSECSGNSSSKKTKYDAKTTLEHCSSLSTARATPTIIETFEGGACNTRYDQTDETHLRNAYDDSTIPESNQGAVMRLQNEVIQVQNRSNFRITTKGAGTNLMIGQNPKVEYNFKDGCPEAIEDSNRETREAVLHNETQLKKAIVESETRIADHVVKLSQQIEELEERTKQNEEMILSSIKSE